MQPLAKGKTLSYTFMLPLLYGQNKQELTKHIKDIDNVYIGENYTIHCVNKSNKAIYSPKIDINNIDRYNLFISGKYSKFDTQFKLLIVKFWYADTNMVRILFKYNTKEYLNKHCWSESREFLCKPSIQLEIYNYK